MAAATSETIDPKNFSELLSSTENDAQFLFELMVLIKEGIRYYSNPANDEFKRLAVEAIVKKLFCANEACLGERFASFTITEADTLNNANHFQISLYQRYKKYFAKVTAFAEKYKDRVITQAKLNEIRQLGAYIMIKYKLEQYIADSGHHINKRQLINDLQWVFLNAKPETLQERWEYCKNNVQYLIAPARAQWSFKGGFNDCYDALYQYVSENPGLVIDAAFIERYNEFGKNPSIEKSAPESASALTFASPSGASPPNNLPGGSVEVSSGLRN